MRCSRPSTTRRSKGTAMLYKRYCSLCRLSVCLISVNPASSLFWFSSLCPITIEGTLGASPLVPIIVLHAQICTCYSIWVHPLSSSFFSLWVQFGPSLASGTWTVQRELQHNLAVEPSTGCFAAVDPSTLLDAHGSLSTFCACVFLPAPVASSLHPNRSQLKLSPLPQLTFESLRVCLQV